jgi:hypothetical protein
MWILRRDAAVANDDIYTAREKLQPKADAIIRMSSEKSGRLNRGLARQSKKKVWRIHR